jgi:hypothetical protein
MRGSACNSSPGLLTFPLFTWVVFLARPWGGFRRVRPFITLRRVSTVVMHSALYLIHILRKPNLLSAIGARALSEVIHAHNTLRKVRAMRVQDLTLIHAQIPIPISVLKILSNPYKKWVPLYGASREGAGAVIPPGVLWVTCNFLRVLHAEKVLLKAEVECDPQFCTCAMSCEWRCRRRVPDACPYSRSRSRTQSLSLLTCTVCLTHATWKGIGNTGDEVWRIDAYLHDVSMGTYRVP